MRNYRCEEAEIIAKEMVDQLCLDMAAKGLVTESVSLFVGYSYTYGVPGPSGTAKLSMETNSASIIIPAIRNLYRRIVIITVIYYGSYEQDYLQITGPVTKVDPFWSSLQIGNAVLNFSGIYQICMESTPASLLHT